jgi:hypothetical protein
MAAQHRHGREPAPAGQYSPVVRRLARPLGGQYARHRRDEFQSEDGFPGLARTPAPDRALDADPTVWTQPWTVKQEFTKQSEAENRIYYEPRCIEGNYGLPGLLHGRRLEEVAFARGRGVDPRTRDSNKAGGLEPDPLQ